MCRNDFRKESLITGLSALHHHQYFHVLNIDTFTLHLFFHLTYFDCFALDYFSIQKDNAKKRLLHGLLLKSSVLKLCVGTNFTFSIVKTEKS